MFVLTRATFFGGARVLFCPHSLSPIAFMGGRLASFVSPLTVSVAIVSDGFSWKKNANCISAPKGGSPSLLFVGFEAYLISLSALRPAGAY
jgi:hypothetical protein